MTQISKTEPSVAKAQNYMGGGHCTEEIKEIGTEETARTFLMEGTIGLGENINWEGGDTAHTLFMREQLRWGHCTTFGDQS